MILIFGVHRVYYLPPSVYSDQLSASLRLVAVSNFSPLILSLATRCGSAPVARRAREELGAAGGRPRRTRISGIQALTASELRVARRAADGRTNREIAQELFVTTKAVEKHLASVYRKLGVEGRAMLAGRLANEPQIPVPAETRATAPG